MSSSDPYRQMISHLSRAKKVLITTHVRPDGDALGSTAALSLALKARGIDSHVLLLSHLPSKYAFIYNDHGIAHHDAEAGWPAAISMDDYDTLAVVDTGTWSQLPGLSEKLQGWTGTKLVLDHHITQQDWADAKLVITQAAAAGEIVAELLEQWDIPLTRPIARAIFLAIVSDTGWFQFSSTRPYTHRLAARLIEAGVDTDELYKLIYQNERAQRIALQARAQSSLQLLADNRLAIMTVRKTDFTETGASVADTEAVINIPLQIRTVEVSILLTELMDNGPVRVSLRSKGAVDVAKFAETFGGGGHARAAGLKVEGDLGDAVRTVAGAMVGVISAKAV